MKIVLDLQGAQSHSRHRGIGRYTLSMAKAFIAEATRHEVWIALNGRADDSSLALIRQFEELIPRDRFLINELPANIAASQPGNQGRVQAAAVAQADFFSRLRADCIWHSSLFEGWGDDSTAALGAGRADHRHVATLYDLIPLLNPSRHLHDAAYRHWYYKRLGLLKRCGLLLAISKSSGREAIDVLQVLPDNVAVVSGAADQVFRPRLVTPIDWARWQRDWQLRPGFVMYAGGYDAHKNVDTLIAAFAQLPEALQKQHPLVLAGRCDSSTVTRLRDQARKYRLCAGSLVFTGMLDDEELARLYSSCQLFVTASLHEGLGLPPLEAMACGAAVIGSDTTSLPEVIGRPDALFDPRSPSSITAKLQAALTDVGFLASLREHAAVQSRKFSWPATARMALAAIEQHAEVERASKVSRRSRPRLIHVSPLPPVRSGIADYSARLLRELGRHYDIDVVVAQPEMSDPWIQANFPVRSLPWFLENADHVERILYHFGNSPFHAHMFGMLQQHAGVVLLHDSSLGAVRNWMAHAAGDPESILRELYQSHGYGAVLYDQRYGRAATLDAWPINRDVLDHALGVIVHSRYAVEQARRCYGAEAAEKFRIVPFPKELTHGSRRLARRLLGIGQDDFVVCSFGMLAPTKLNHRLLAAWLGSPLAADASCHLVFVGENHGGDYGQALATTIRDAAGGGRIRITGYVDARSYADCLDAADVVVQLRTDSRGETSAAIFDALGHGLPLIVNAHGTATELPDAAVLRISDHFSDAELAEALYALRHDGQQRDRLGAEAIELIRRGHHPAEVARCIGDAIEAFVDESAAGEKRQFSDLQQIQRGGAEGQWMHAELRRILGASRPRLDRPCIYVDVTATADSDLHTGIERVVKGVLTALLQLDQTNYRIEPVRMVEGQYVLAPAFALRMLGHSPMALAKPVVQPRAGDVLLGLDWVADMLPRHTALLDAWRVRGARMLFVVYDLLPVRRPDWFPDGIAEMHAQWLQCIGHYADALLCISRFVVDDVRDWFNATPPVRNSSLPLGYFHPGNDLDTARRSTGLPAESDALLQRLRTSPSFLMVGTVEPRKGHALVLEAIGQLWAEGIEVNLVVVGRQGWLSEVLATRMRTHAAADGRLVWLEKASDEYLEQLYDSAHALVAASEAEGFGLPLVEAARRGLPVIARDIPVFREVSSAFASYFDGANVSSLVQALRHSAETARVVRVSAAVPGWEETTGRLWAMLADEGHPQWLAPWVPRA